MECQHAEDSAVAAWSPHFSWRDVQNMGFHYVHPQEASTDSEYEFCVPSFTSQVWLFTMKKVSATGGRAVELQCNVAKVFCTYSHLSLANTTLKAHYIAPDHVTVSSGRLARVLQLSMRLPLV